MVSFAAIFFACNKQTLRSKDAFGKYEKLSYRLKTSKFIPLRQKNAFIDAEVTQFVTFSVGSKRTSVMQEGAYRLGTEFDIKKVVSLKCQEIM
jgi:hypothetical protein